MKKIIQWHVEAIYGGPQDASLNLEMSKELGKVDSISYIEYVKMCKRMSVSPMKEETFIVRYEKL
jgi:hypothetical protein